MSDLLGYAASAAVLATFLMRSMVPLRLVAILSNLLFLSYGYVEHIHPVFLLHTALLPINVARLATQYRDTAPVRPRENRCVTTIVGRAHQIALFVFGFIAGLLGMRTLFYLATLFYNHCRRGFV
jgi:hypothetical protein